ncbi:MAG: hypothetical protein E5Y02_10410 [Mesorhizobium sp.]|nr:MAG: hypothetical protein E5Y02_10410 [Mesorhizobium sp.]
MNLYSWERDPAQVAADKIADSTDAIKSAAKMRADLAAAKGAPESGDSAFDEARMRAYRSAPWNK